MTDYLTAVRTHEELLKPIAPLLRSIIKAYYLGNISNPETFILFGKQFAKELRAYLTHVRQFMDQAPGVFQPLFEDSHRMLLDLPNSIQDIFELGMEEFIKISSSVFPNKDEFKSSVARLVTLVIEESKHRELSADEKPYYDEMYVSRTRGGAANPDTQEYQYPHDMVDEEVLTRDHVEMFRRSSPLAEIGQATEAILSDFEITSLRYMARLKDNRAKIKQFIEELDLSEKQRTNIDNLLGFISANLDMDLKEVAKGVYSLSDFETAFDRAAQSITSFMESIVLGTPFPKTIWQPVTLAIARNALRDYTSDLYQLPPGLFIKVREMIVELIGKELAVLCHLSLNGNRNDHKAYIHGFNQYVRNYMSVRSMITDVEASSIENRRKKKQDEQEG